MNRITWILALSAFVLTLGISSWHEGLWSTDEAASEEHPAPIKLSLAEPTAATRMAAVPFGPSQAATRALLLPEAPPELDVAAPPAPAAAAPPDTPPEVSDPQPQTEPYNTPDVDNGEMQSREDRAAAHSSRSH